MNVDKLAAPVVTVLSTAALGYAFSQPIMGSLTFFYVTGGLYFVLALVAVARMFRDGTLIDMFKWRSGDLAIGVGSALALGLAIHGGRMVLAPRMSLKELWVARLYAQLPEPGVGGQRLLLLIAALAVVSALMIIAWQGLVQQALEEWLGVRRGFIVTAVLFALAHAPTIKLCEMPGAGLNPLLVFATLLCGLVWGFLAGRLQRLGPSLVSSMALAISLVTQFRVWP